MLSPTSPSIEIQGPYFLLLCLGFSYGKLGAGWEKGGVLKVDDILVFYAAGI